MKKKLLTILLSIFMILMALPTVVFAEISTVEDVIDTYSGFPGPWAAPWENTKGGISYYDPMENCTLIFDNNTSLYDGVGFGIVFTESVTASESDYVYTKDGKTVTFHMSDNKLSYISLSGSSVSETNGDYYPSKSVDTVNLSSIGEDYVGKTPADLKTSLNAFETDGFKIHSHKFFTKDASGNYDLMDDSQSFVAGKTYNFTVYLNAKDYYYFEGEFDEKLNLYCYSGSLVPSEVINKIVLESSDSTTTSNSFGKFLYLSFDFIVTNATKTIADLLATVDSFPSSDATAWLSEKDAKMYTVDGAPNNLLYGSHGLQVTNELTKSGSDYTITTVGGDSLTFKMNGDVLEKIIVEGISASEDGCDGTYMPQDVNYEMIEGKKVTINAKDNKDYSYFTSDADFARFKNVIVDNSTLTKDVDYTVKSGSTKITLKAAFINSLENGSHTLKIVSNNGSATTTFTITRDSNPSPAPKYIIPKTGIE